MTTALLTLACCLLSAPVANADFEDLFDVVLGAASAGPDLGDLGAVPGDLGAFDVHDFLQDPLAQLDQAFHDSPGQLGLGGPEAGPADTTHDPGTAPDTTPGTTPDQGAGTTPDHDAGSNTGTGSEHSSSGGNSNSGNSPSLPKFSMPSGGNGGGGNGGGGNGAGSGNGATKAKANASATKDTLVPTPAPQPEAP